MGSVRPVFDMQRMHFVRAHHFLQTDDIGAPTVLTASR
ncbi:hypothetical protein LTSEWAN_1386, partial [Salmonella enterica subsp. enterica serovar Wandsworth str. A4-580]